MPLKYSHLLIYKRFVIFPLKKETGKNQKAIKPKIPKQNKINAHTQQQTFPCFCHVGQILVVMDSDLECA